MQAVDKMPVVLVEAVVTVHLSIDINQLSIFYFFAFERCGRIVYAGGQITVWEVTEGGARSHVV